ncbi:CPBP family intramembrane glutamic endopeptidase [Micromonospora ureilytica]|uniref:CPBP family intramembrane glutamic endopeptidase n=1 Tax=Micromonospora ureilytica TaxID=709868 RepID=UPI002E136F50|nr:CPBP family intramembrane metalloprotease [Micromonospora ureilytica]
MFLGLLTPLGEELLFRGVVANALLRYGPVVGVVGSDLVFALYHGINSVLPGAFFIGLVTAELFRRTGSVWPSVVVHVVVNLPAPLISVLAGLGLHVAQADLAPPAWVDARVLRRAWFPAELAIHRADALAWAPAAFRKHGVYLSVHDLAAA